MSKKSQARRAPLHAARAADRLARRDRREIASIADRLSRAAGEEALAADLAASEAAADAALRCGEVLDGRHRTCRADCRGCGRPDVLGAHVRPSLRDGHVYATAAHDEYHFVLSLPIEAARQLA